MILALTDLNMDVVEKSVAHTLGGGTQCPMDHWQTATPLFKYPPGCFCTISEPVSPATPQLFILWPFIEQVCWPRFR